MSGPIQDLKYALRALRATFVRTTRFKVLLLLVGGAACYLPARRAAAVDPMVAREEPVTPARTTQRSATRSRKKEAA